MVLAASDDVTHGWQDTALDDLLACRLTRPRLAQVVYDIGYRYMRERSVDGCDLGLSATTSPRDVPRTRLTIDAVTPGKPSLGPDCSTVVSSSRRYHPFNKA